MNYIDADAFEYHLTDEDYITISQKIKDDIYDIFLVDDDFFIEDHELYDSNFLIHLENGDLDVCYTIWCEGTISAKEDISSNIVDEVNVFFWGRDRDGAEWEHEVEVDRSKIKF